MVFRNTSSALTRYRYFFILLFSVLICGASLHAQNKTLDSLKNVLKTSKGDSLEVNTLNEIAKELTNTGAYDKARNYAEQARILAEQLSYQKGLAEYYSTLGIIYYYQGNVAEALNVNLASLKIREKLGDKKGIAGSYNNLAVIYNFQGNYKEALRYLLLALQIKEDLGDKKGVVTTYNNIGLTYSDEKNYPEALKYLDKARIKSAETGNKKSEANALHNIGGIYFALEKYDTALTYFKKALAIRDSMGNRQGIVSSLITAGETYVHLKQYKLAHDHLEGGLALALELKNKEGIKNSYSGLATLAEAENNFKDAYKFYKLFREAQDSLKNDENTKKAVAAEMNYAFERKQAIAKAEQDKKDAIQQENEKVLQEKSEKQQLMVYFISGMLLLVVVFSVFVYRGFLQKRNANRELDVKNQKIQQAYKIIETKNQEITDSINYAQRIQNAILPSANEISAAFPESFVFYRPKDIVGGDFYYFMKREQSCFIAAADCTGHGVPGAFMSLIGSKELQLANGVATSPGKILGQINIGLKATLKQNNLDATKDGMDVAMLKIKNNTVDYAGANRPLWILRKNAAEIEEIKGTKSAIGGFTPDEQEFTEHRLEMTKGDTVYFFTDGYADQFGGQTGNKKLSTKRFKELLVKNSSQNMQEQLHSIESFFDEWKGNIEQLDDILVIGIRF